MTDINPTPEMLDAGFKALGDELGISASYVTYFLTEELLAKTYAAMRKLEPKEQK